MPIDFDKYLNQRLKEIQLDESVFGSYITSILEDESTDQEKSEALEDVLAGVAVCLNSFIFFNYNEMMMIVFRYQISSHLSMKYFLIIMDVM